MYAVFTKLCIGCIGNYKSSFLEVVSKTKYHKFPLPLSSKTVYAKDPSLYVPQLDGSISRAAN